MLLETDRLLIRDPLAEDAEALFKVYGDPIMMRYLPDPYTFEEVEVLISRLQAYSRANGICMWTVVLKETQEVVGDCGLLVQEFMGGYDYELGYHIHTNQQGRGIATEAAHACLEWAFANTNCERVLSFTATDNIASRRVAEKVHTEFMGDCGEMWGHPYCYYGTNRPDFENR